MGKLYNLLKIKLLISVLAVFFSGISYGQNWEILPLSKKVGTVLDAEENLFYSVYTNIRGFESAQYYQINDDIISVRLVSVNKGVNKVSNKRMSIKAFIVLQNRINAMPQITVADREDLKKDLVYLQADEILKSIPINRYVRISRVSGLKIRGKLHDYDGKEMTVKTIFGARIVPVWNLKKIAVRQIEKPRPKLRWVVPAICGSAGFVVSSILVPNKYKDTDRETYYRLAGSVAGLTATTIVISSIQAYLTPMDSYNLNPKKMKMKK